MPERSEMDQWMIKMDPNMAAVFDIAYNALEAEKKAIPNSKGIVDAEEQKLLKARESAQGKVAAPKTEQVSGENGKLPVAGSYEIGGKLPEKTFPLTKYGKITFTGTAKLSVSNANAGDTAAVGGVSTTLDPKKGAQTSVAMGVSVGLGDFDLFESADVDVEGLSLNFKNTFDAEKVEISFAVEGTLDFNGAKKVKVSNEVRLLSLDFAEGKLAAIADNFAVGPFSVDTTIKGAKVTGQCTCIATIEPDEVKVAATVAKKVIVDLIEKEVEKQVEKAAVEQGAKMVAAEVAGQFLSKLNPLMTAFSVGYAAGQILTKYTHAGQTAEAVDGAGLDDFKNRFQKEGTAGKVFLALENSGRIAATVVASGVAGTAEGILEVNEKVYGGAYHAIKDRFSETEVDQEGLKAAQEVMNETPMSKECEQIYTPERSTSFDDPAPPPPPKTGPAKQPGR